MRSSGGENVDVELLKCRLPGRKKENYKVSDISTALQDMLIHLHESIGDFGFPMKSLDKMLHFFRLHQRSSTDSSRATTLFPFSGDLERVGIQPFANIKTFRSRYHIHLDEMKILPSFLGSKVDDSKVGSVFVDIDQVTRFDVLRLH